MEVVFLIFREKVRNILFTNKNLKKISFDQGFEAQLRSQHVLKISGI